MTRDTYFMGEAVKGAENLLKSNSVEVMVLNDSGCGVLRFTSENPDIWNEELAKAKRSEVK